MGVYLYVVKKIILIEKDEVAFPTKGYGKQIIKYCNNNDDASEKVLGALKKGQTARLRY